VNKDQHSAVTGDRSSPQRNQKGMAQQHIAASHPDPGGWSYCFHNTLRCFQMAWLDF